MLVFVTYAEILIGDRAPATNDFFYFGYPLASHLKTSLLNGELPLWNPLSECGVPFLAQWNTLALYPGSLFYLAFPLEWSLAVLGVLHLYLGGLGAWLLIRHLTRDPLAAAVGGLIYTFNGFMQACQMWPNNAAALGWAPWVWWLVIMGTREGGRTLLVGAFAGAMQMLTGAPEIILATWLLVAGFVVQDAWSAERTVRRRRGVRFIGIVALVTTLAAAQLIPFLDLLAHSPRRADSNDLSWPIQPLGLVNYVMPLFNTITKPSGRFAHHQQGWIHSYYVGGAVLWLVVFAWLRSRGRVLWLAGGGVVFAWLLAMGEHTGLHTVLGKLIPLGFTRFPAKFMIVPALLLPFIAALGMRAWARTAAAERARSMTITTLITLVLLGLAYAVMAERPLEGEDHAIRLANGRTRLLLAALAMGGIWFVGCAREPRGGRLAFGALAFVLWLDFQRHQPHVMVTVPREIYRLEHPVLAEVGPELQNRRARMALLGRTQLENAYRNQGTGEELLGMARLEQFLNLNLLDGVMKLDGFFALWFPEQEELEHTLHSWSMTDLRPGLADFLAITHTTSTDSPLEWRRRPSAKPLVTAGQAPVFEDARASVARLTELDFDSSAIVSLRPEAETMVQARGTTNASVELHRFDPHEVAFTVETDVPTMAVIAQCYHHPWQPTIDGKPARLLRANHAFQAVNVPAGRHEVRLRYVDRGFHVGMVISLTGLVLLGCLWWRWRPSARPTSP